MARTIIVSDFADQLDHALNIGTNTPMETIDQFLRPVRECLGGLKQRDLPSGPCWCGANETLRSIDVKVFESVGFKHSAACLASRKVWESIQVKEN